MFKRLFSCSDVTCSSLLQHYSSPYRHNHVFWPLALLALAACPLTVAVVLVQNLPLSQSPILSAFCAWKRALRPCESERGRGLRKVRQAGALLEKNVQRLSGRTPVFLPVCRHCPNSETASIHSTKANLPSFPPSLAWLASPTWPCQLARVTLIVFVSGLASLLWLCLPARCVISIRRKQRL